MSDLRAKWVTILTGQTFGSYRLSTPLGGGGFGLVFLGEHIETGEQCAIKVLRPDSPPGSSLEFEREERLLAKLTKSSNVVSILGSGQQAVPMESGGVVVPFPFPYVRLELASGCLDELFTSEDELSWEERLLLWRGVILGVHQMHLRHMVHRDLKTSNCLLFVGSGQRPKTTCKVADLGRSRDMGEKTEHSRDVYSVGRGDLRFLAPEFIWAQGDDSEQGHRCADLYGLGSVLFELATGIGLTSFALNPTRDVVRQNFVDRKNGVSTDLSAFRGRYNEAFKYFEQTLPKSIAKDCTDLLRILCDPVPRERLRFARRGSRKHQPDSLEWLLRRVDILVRRLRAHEPKRQHLASRR